MATEKTGLAGQVNMVLRDKYGYIKEERSGPNTVVNGGIGEIVQLAAGTGGDAFTHIAIGTGTTTATVTDTTLEAEIDSNGGGRAASSVTAEEENTANDTIQLASTWSSFSGELSIAESGVFNDASTGDMLCRQTFTALAVDDGDSLTITWRVTLDQAP